MSDYKDKYFNNLRKLIGLIGILMPCALLAYTLLDPECNIVLKSISAYYHSKAGHIFSACSLVIGVVIWNTIKYPEDKWLYRLAAVLAIIIGFVPNCQDGSIGGCIIRQNKIDWINWIHLGSAIIFFVLLSYLVYFRFTKSEDAEISYAKQNRNRVFRICGIVMMVTMVLIAISATIMKGKWDSLRPIFVGETIMLFAFSYAWLIKGQFWMKEKNGFS